MSNYPELAAGLTEALELAMPPVAVSLVDEVPEGVRRFSGSVPAGCVFWQEARNGAFATAATDHELCAIGVHTHNLAEPSATQSSELGEVLKVMADLDYVSEEEVASIPVAGRQARYVVYAPLADAPLPPDVILLFADSRQGLVITEAVQRIQPAGPPAMGRPACAVIPQVINSGMAAVSLGCCGARAYLDELADGIALWAIPGHRMTDFVGQVEIMAGANKTLASFHKQRRADVQSGDRPTIRESLARLSS